ncbi:hypothetical protein GCM10011390_51220 [Aureimonas endophytica]|uniref:Uncharacterized protein n=1 Tax=Aureimonas endophytica TaxID=2027858 RepID=A0A917A3V1_9HYPH|nr:hypothetical protein [Aureimonas endophytica]GGE25517.1 hypothetical protein GCM10011390_51220 [Aureimonas endophytica]
MPVQSLTYSELAEIWGISKEAARKKVEGLRLPRRIGNDGKARVQIDLEEVRHTPKASRPETVSPPGADPAGGLPASDAGDPEETGRSPSPEVLLLQGRVADLKSDLERERAERLAERDRADRLAGELNDRSRRLENLVDELLELAALRERLVASDRQHDEAEKRHVAELEKIAAAGRSEAERARAELEAWKAMPWWKRLAG